MKILIVPDSFKGSMTAQEFCTTAKKCIHSIMPDTQVIQMPVADGGEGTLDCILSAVEGFTETIKVTGAFAGEERSVRVGFTGNTAIIESAEAMGLPSVGERKNPLLTTTYGVGQMIENTIQHGAKKIILTLGGSSTNDCGAGMLSALGACFYDRNGKLFVPTGGTLSNIASCDFSAMQQKLSGIQITAMCDVTNPLCGENGCSFIFAPQKGADEKTVHLLDESCHHFAHIVPRGNEFIDYPGAGAAGGLGFACVACMNATLQSGIETILNLYSFESHAKDADLIITGEGCFDSQSLMGKTIGGIIARAGNIPVAVFCGISHLSEAERKKHPLLSVHEISSGQDPEYAMTHAVQNLEREITNYTRILNNPC